MNLQIFQQKINSISIEVSIVIIFFLGLLIRTIVPNLKLLHHDETIHAWFSYELLTKGTYQYDPMYHGPLLYYLTSGAFRIFGDSDLIVRLLPGIFGTLIILLIYLLNHFGWLSKNHTLWAALFFAFSPDMVYFSRFLRHDIFQLFFTVLLLVAIIAYFEKKQLFWAIIAGLSAACGMCLKEDMPIAIIIFGIFFLILIFTHRIKLPLTWVRDLIIALIVAIITGFIFYSSFFSHPEAFFEAPFKAFMHWTSMHEQCRLCGPPYWYLLMFLLYELPILLLAIYGVWEFGLKNKGLSKLKQHLNEVEIKNTFELKKGYLMLLALIWSVVTIIFYGYVGEKVPWLLIHQLFPVILLASYNIRGKKNIAGILTIIFLLIMTIHVCFTPADINEPIVQVQNSEDLNEVIKLINASNTTIIASDTYWPLPWYFRGEKWDKILFYGKKVDPSIWVNKNPEVVITHDTDSYSSLPGYNKSVYQLNYWFSWYDNQNRIVPWYFLRDGKMGSVNLDVFTHNQ
jgi:uncharacterized protein (TIGR03663 family)